MWDALLDIQGISSRKPALKLQDHIDKFCLVSGIILLKIAGHYEIQHVHMCTTANSMSLMEILS